MHETIVSTPGVCGGSARIVHTRIPVWTLEGLRRMGATDDDLRRAFPSLPAAALVQAWAYVENHPAEIELAIRENEDD